MDDRTEKTIATLHPAVQPKFRAFMVAAQELAEIKGLEYRGISGLRSMEEQARIYAQGRTTPGRIVSNAKPGSSFHNFGLAMDCGVFKKNGARFDYLDKTSPATADRFHRLAGAMAKAHGLRWGGTFRNFEDIPHFELDTPLTLAELRDRHARGIPLLG